MNVINILKSKLGFGRASNSAPATAESVVEAPAQPPELAAIVQHPAELPEECREIAQAPRILDRVTGELSAAGLVGEKRAVALLYLALTSRLLDRPVSLAMKGPSSAGKSRTVQGVLDLFPKSAYFCMTAMSEKALAYFAESLEHRFMVLFEAEGMSGKFATYFVRSLLSEGCLKYDTVERGPDGPRAKHIERPGPTGLITTTTLPKLHPENETRFFSVPVNDTPEQTARILLAIAGNRAQAHQIDLAAWIKFQEWLSTGERRVIVPYAENLAGLVPPLAIRLRRDFPALLTLIESHALLHRESRERDQEGRIVATMEDYAAIKELVADLISEGVSASVSPTIRETVEAVKVLYEQFPYGVSLSELAKALKLDKSVVSRRVAAAEKDHYLLNEEPQRGKPARLRVGEPLPDEVQVLPTVETLDRCSVAA